MINAHALDHLPNLEHQVVLVVRHLLAVILEQYILVLQQQILERCTKKHLLEVDGLLKGVLLVYHLIHIIHAIRMFVLIRMI